MCQDIISLYVKTAIFNKLFQDIRLYVYKKWQSTVSGYKFVRIYKQLSTVSGYKFVRIYKQLSTVSVYKFVRIYKQLSTVSGYKFVHKTGYELRQHKKFVRI